MTLGKSISIILLIMSASAAFAGERQIQKVTPGEFQALTTAQLNSGTIDYSDEVVPFAEWSSHAPIEKDFLLLYPDYVEPTVTYMKYGMPHQRTEHLTIFTSRMKTIVDKKPSEIDLKKFLNIATVNKFDPEMSHKAIGPEQVISRLVAEHKPITSFQWCNAKAHALAIQRPAKELNLSYINPPNRAWCADASRSLCLESCYIFGDFWWNAVHLVNLSMHADQQKDYGFGMQSEIRYFTGESELNKTHSVQDLTGIHSPMTGALEQNMFYFNQLIEYAKILAVFQSDPSDANKTILTSYFVVAIKTRTYMKNKMVPLVLMGQFPGLNRGTGITAGLPAFTQSKFEAITQALAL